MKAFTILALVILSSLFAYPQITKEIDSLKRLLPYEKESIEKINHFLTLSEKLYLMYDYDQEKQFLDSAKYLSEKLNYREGLPRYQNEYGKILYMEGKYSEALDNYLSSLNLAEKSGDSITVSKVCTNLAVVHGTQGKGDTALMYSDRSLKIAEEIKDTSILLRAYDKRAFVYRNMGNFEQAIEIYEKAIHMAELFGDKYQTANITLNLGIVYKFQENNTKALEMFFKGYPYFDTLGIPMVMGPLNNCIGGIYAHQKEFPEALKFLSLSYNCTEELGLKQWMAINLNSLSEVNLVLKNYKEALEEAEQALQINNELQDQSGIAASLINIGKANESQGGLSQALKTYKEALLVSEKTGDKNNISLALLGLGNVYLKMALSKDDKGSKDDYKKAYEFLQKSLQLSLEMKQQERLRDTYYSLYQIENNTGDYYKALESYKLYSVYDDSIYKSDYKHKLTEAEYSFLREQKNKEIVLLTNENQIKTLQIEKQKIQRDGLLIISGFILLLAIVIIRSIQLRKKIEKQKALALERDRISADLHDDISSGLSKIILTSEVLKQENVAPAIKKKLNEISNESVELSKNISEVIWALNSRNDFLDNLIAYIRKYSSSYFENSSIHFKSIISKQIPHIELSSEQRRNIFLIVKEAEHNIVKHSKATEAEMAIKYKGQNLFIEIHDNGVGIEHIEKNQFGNGLIQMDNRLKSIGGEFFIENKIGTTVKFSVPVHG